MQFWPALIVGVSDAQGVVPPTATANWVLSPPVTAMELTISDVVPLFVIVTWVAVEVCPVWTEPKGIGPTGDTAMSGLTPVPFKVTVAFGVPKSFEAMVSVDVLPPTVVGLKVTFTVQFWPALIVGVSDAQGVVPPTATANWVLSPPVTAMELTISDVVPLFVIVTWVAAEVCPVWTEPKGIGPTGDTAMSGLTPVPFKVTVAFGVPKSFEAMVSVDVLPPTVVGLKVTFTVQFWPALIVGVSDAQGVVPPTATANWVLSPPVTAMELTISDVVPLFVIVTWVAVEVWPVWTEPKGIGQRGIQRCQG